MSQLLPKVLFDVFDANGAPAAGAKLFFYESGTTTDAPAYTDATLATAHAQPVVANSAGRFPPIFLDEGAHTYRVKINDADDALIADFDPVNSTGSVGTGQLQNGAVTEPKLGDLAVSHRVMGLGAVANENTSDMAEATFKGRAAGQGTGPTQDISSSQAATVLGLTGMIAAFGMSAPPAGWLECDGSAVSRAAYAALFAAIGTTWGSGDGSTTFKLPDLRGEFLRSWDHGKGTDSGRAFASSQADDLKHHSHTFTAGGGSSGPRDYVSVDTPSTDSQRTTDETGGAETRPRNVAILYAIRT